MHFDSERERFRRVAARFTDVVESVPAAAWSNPAPCEGWTARDVVRHLVEWVPSFFSRAGIDLPISVSVDDDPAKAWAQLRDALQAKLDDPEVAASEIDIEPVGRHTVAAAIEQFVTGDIVVHTWDLAKAAGVDATIDHEMAARMVPPMTRDRRHARGERPLRQSGGRSRRRQRRGQAGRGDRSRSGLDTTRRLTPEPAPFRGTSIFFPPVSHRVDGVRCVSVG